MPHYQDIKYVCFGIAAEYGTPLTRVIEHETLFVHLLKEVEQLIAEPRKFRRCYQGLLKAYFHYDGQNTEKLNSQKNWLILREFLRTHHKVLKKQKPIIEWVQALDDHLNLLADEPCKPYGKDLLAGDTSIVDELKNRLGVDDDTWIMEELILAKVQAATNLTDEAFFLKVMPLVQLLEQHSLLLSRGLATLLKRYVKSQTHPDYPTLRDAVLRAWKSPWLEVHKPLWYAQVGEEATNMVSLWLKKRSIQDFFELLQADGRADSDRKDFWLKYAAQMEDIWLALGEFAYFNNKPDYQRIRQNMDGRFMALTGGSYNNDNAFIMRIGGFVFIEFAKSGSACHVFSEHNLPFEFGQKSVLGTQDGLKNREHPGHQTALIHNGNWQCDFDLFLRSRANAVASENKPNARQSSQFVSFNSSKSVHTRTKESINPQVIDIKEIIEFCKEHNLPFDDLRSKGGAFWVRVPENHRLGFILKDKDFRYKQAKGWWIA